MQKKRKGLAVVITKENRWSSGSIIRVRHKDQVSGEICYHMWQKANGPKIPMLGELEGVLTLHFTPKRIKK